MSRNVIYQETQQKDINIQKEDLSFQHIIEVLSIFQLQKGHLFLWGPSVYPPLSLLFLKLSMGPVLEQWGKDRVYNHTYYAPECMTEVEKNWILRQGASYYCMRLIVPDMYIELVKRERVNILIHHPNLFNEERYVNTVYRMEYTDPLFADFWQNDDAAQNFSFHIENVLIERFFDKKH